MKLESIAGYVYGPYVCGDSIDLKGDTLLTGSYSGDTQIQLWDIRTFKAIENISWDERSKNIETNIFSAKFHQSRDLLAIGSSNSNHFQIYDSNEYNIYGAYRFLDKPVYTLDFSNNSSFCAFGGADGSVRVMAI